MFLEPVPIILHTLLWFDIAFAMKVLRYFGVIFGLICDQAINLRRNFEPLVCFNFLD